MEGGTLSVGIVGVAGLVGQELLELLEARQLPVGKVRLFGSMRTAGAELELGDGRTERIELLQQDSFTDLDLAFFTSGPRVAGEFAPAAVNSGASVIDLSSRFRLDPAVPLVVPEVNAAAIRDAREAGIIASPSATAIGLSVALAPLREAAGLRRVVVATYQGTAGAGRAAVNQLSREALDLLAGRGTRRARVRPRAFNCLPQIGAIEPGGATTHELHAIEEVRKVLEHPTLPISITAVRVPTFFGYGMAVTCETEEPLSPEAAADVLRQGRGLIVHDEPGSAYPTPVEVVGSDATHVGRIRTDAAVENGLAFWVSLDNVRKGGALNAVELAEIIVRDLL
jgi:aspartate-semialdehyde dehydrogenase